MRTRRCCAPLLACCAALWLVDISSAQCVGTATDTLVNKQLKRVTGNSMQSTATAWVEGDYWWNWTDVTVNSNFYVQRSTGNLQIEQRSQRVTTSPYIAQVISTGTLQVWGPGGYILSAGGTFKCGTLTQTEPPLSVGPFNVSRPIISAPSNAFWYLGGAYNIDGYAVTMSITGNPNTTDWAIPPGQTLNLTWAVTNNPSKVSLSTTSGNATTLTSQAASNGPVFDVSVVFRVDGFPSDPVSLHINTPSYLSLPTFFDLASGTGCSGYETLVDYVIRDLWNYALVKVTTHEVFSNWQNGPNPPTQGWLPLPSPATWYPSDPNAWIDNYTFRDVIWAYDCGNTWRPQPTGPVGGQSLVRTASQAINVGSAFSGQGKNVQNKTMYWYTDHGRVN